MDGSQQIVILNLDEKSRLRIPKKILVNFPDKKVYTRYSSAGCLELMTEEEYKSFTEFCCKHKAFSDNKAQRAIRILGASTRELVYDSQERFTLDAATKQFMGLQKEYVYINYGTTYELWAKEKWDEYSNPVIFDQDNFDECLAMLDELKKNDEDNEGNN